MKRLLSVAVCLVVAAALVATSAGGAAGGETSAKDDSLPPAIAKMIANPESAVAEFGLDASRARQAEVQSGAGEVWFVPGKAGGACLFAPDGGGSCANADQTASGLLALGVLPAPSAESQASGTLIGYAPAGVTAIRLVDKDGGVVSAITPQEDTRIYDVPLGSSPAVKLMLVDASGKAVSTLPLPAGAPGP